MLRLPPTMHTGRDAARRIFRRAVRRCRVGIAACGRATIPVAKNVMRGVVRSCSMVSPRALTGAIVVVVAIVAGGMWFWLRWRVTPLPPVRPPSADVKPAPVGTKPNWIDGRTLLPDAQQPRAIAVSVDNAPEARPQTSIADAPLVFEVPVEGQRTRFLAVFAAYTPVDIAGDGYGGGYLEYRETVGPVRSVRPYCIGIANVLGVPIVHAGGSPAAIALLKNIPHVDEWYDAPFTRSRKRVPPFNLYTTIADLAAYLAERDQRGAVRTDAWKLWGYTAKPFDGEQNGTHVALQYGGERAFDVSWSYDTAQGVYVRSQGKKIHRDIDGDAVTAKNVVVLRVESTVLDRVGRLAIPQLDPNSATGVTKRLTAEVYSGGHRYPGTWAWQDPEGDAGLFGLRHESLEGGDPATMAPILLQPGTTWVEVANF